jgi:hypothetical protein
MGKRHEETRRVDTFGEEEVGNYFKSVAEIQSGKLCTGFIGLL